jgi:hypothetical protein
MNDFHQKGRFRYVEREITGKEWLMERLLEHNTRHKIFISDRSHVVSEISAFLHISTPSSVYLLKHVNKTKSLVLLLKCILYFCLYPGGYHYISARVKYIVQLGNHMQESNFIGCWYQKPNTTLYIACFTTMYFRTVQ